MFNGSSSSSSLGKHNKTYPQKVASASHPHTALHCFPGLGTFNKAGCLVGYSFKMVSRQFRVKPKFPKVISGYAMIKVHMLLLK